MIRTRIIKMVEPHLVERCQREDAVNIRELLVIRYENALTNLVKGREDHRYNQGYLQALEDIYGNITKE